ncbi:MAG TPA: response regulator [Myxococcota bacterium]|nr:response regulator [Myxococcota bacterium]
MTSGRRVLLVDDDADIRFIAEIALARVGGLAVTLAGSADEARLRLAEDPLPDAVLLDVTMPVCDGPTLFAELRGIPRYGALPIIFLTARTTLEDVQGYLALGAAGVVAKPFDPMTLARQVGEILGWR